ncbi:MAG: metal-dependent transcriptional regulator [Myxococcales bacterium]|nr:metal-dependent transcriptional regulator [Myxococcales bacterium]
MSRSRHDLREELLEQAWVLEEEGGGTRAELLRRAGPQAAPAQLESLVQEGLVVERDDRVELTSSGRRQARSVVRANRLAARLLADVLELPPDVVEEQACCLEHAIGPQVADALCTLLGHPPTTPGGRPIPAGPCCDSRRTELKPVVVQLAQLRPGERGRVSFIHGRVAARLEQLSSLGLIPGVELHLRQRYPSIVLEIGETTLALDHEVARDIFVKQSG